MGSLSPKISSFYHIIETCAPQPPKSVHFIIYYCDECLTSLHLDLFKTSPFAAVSSIKVFSNYLVDLLL